MATTQVGKQVIQNAKSNLRRIVNANLSKIPAQRITEQSDIVSQAVLHQAFYHCAKRISVYLSMPDKELNTTEVVRKALHDGKQVFVPYLRRTTESDRGPDGYLPARCMDMLRLHSLADFQSLERDKWNIPTISEKGVGERESILKGKGDEKEVEGLDLMLLPGVAFQVGKQGEIRRLGHGKGFYDFFLRRLRAGIETKGSTAARRGEGWPRLVGLALEEQVLKETDEELPLGENDQILDSVVVGDGRILGGKESSWRQVFPEYRQEEVVEGMKKRDP